MVLSKLLFNLNSISIGVSLYSDHLRHAIVWKDKAGKNHLLSSGNGIPWYIKLFTPVIAHADLLNTPVLVTTEDLGDSDPDQWIDKNEEKIIPTGFSADQVANEYEVHGSKLFSFTAAIKARDSIIEHLGKDISLISLSPPLWDLAALYWEHIKKPFVIWKITDNGSILGRVENGRVVKLCNFWPDTNDLKSDSKELAKEIMPIIKSIAGEIKPVPLLIFSPEKDLTIPEDLVIAGCELVTNPDLPGIPKWDHEVYALACHNDSHLNFVPFVQIQKAKKTLNLWRKTVDWARIALTITLLSFLVLVGAHLSEVILVRVNQDSLAGVKEQLDLIQNETVKRDSLLELFKQKATFIADESAVTGLMSDLQVVFPEGMWAEEITITEIDNHKYRLDIRALAFSSSLIGPCISNLQTLRGITNTRMVYSEQTDVQRSVKGIRVKLECVFGRVNGGDESMSGRVDE